MNVSVMLSSRAPRSAWMERYRKAKEKIPVMFVLYAVLYKPQGKKLYIPFRNGRNLIAVYEKKSDTLLDLRAAQEIVGNDNAYVVKLGVIS